MDSTINRILGEAEDETDTPENEQKKVEKPDAVEVSDKVIGPEDAEIDELASLWTMGNKGEVVLRFLEMDNETSVKLVFAIGREGALELARMVDQRVKETPLTGDEGEVNSSEPERIEPPRHTDDYPVAEIIGRPHVMPP